MMDQPPLGHKSPKPGYARLTFCPACIGCLTGPARLTSRHEFYLCLAYASVLRSIFGSYFDFFFRHVLEDCLAISFVRKKEGISDFLTSCREMGMSKAASYTSYVMGKSCQGIQIPVHEHLARGASLSRLTDAWLETWFDEDV